jgi:hypothetical protein
MSTKTLAIASGAILVSVVGGYLWLEHDLRRVGAVLAGPASRALGRSVKASAAPVVTSPRELAKPGIPGAHGALTAYPEGSEATKLNDMLVDTWLNGTAASDEIWRDIKGVAQFRGSVLEIPSVSPAHRLDGWGHPFCVSKSGQNLLLVSQGGTGQPIDCRLLKVRMPDQAKVPERKIIDLSEGRLGLFFQFSPD